MLSNFQEFLKDEVLERLQELDENKELDEFQPSEKNEKLLEVSAEVLSQDGFWYRYKLVSVEEGAGKAKIKADGIFLDEETADLYVFLSVFDDQCAAKITQKQIYALMKQSTRFVENSIRGKIVSPTFSAEAKGIAEEIKQAYQEGKFDRVITWLVTNQISALAGEPFQDRYNEDLKLDYRFEVYDSDRLAKVGSQSIQRADIYIDLEQELGRPLDCLEVLPAKEEYNTYLSIFPGELLYSLFDKFGQSLFEFNVRSFLQARSKVNRGIKDTLRDEPEMFLAYNNGLVVTVDEIEVGFLDSRSVIKSIRGLQIVNGAQTTSSIYAAKKRHKHSLQKVAVPVKITQVKEEQLAEFVPLISKYANSQNNIQVADLSANHPYHIKVENLSRSIWTPGEQSQWFFERTRGSYESEMMQAAATAKQKRDFLKQYPKSQKFDKTEMAKYLVCWDLRRPFQVALGNQKNFGLFMQSFDEIFGKDWQPDKAFFRRMVAINILFKAARKAYMQQTKGFPAPVSTYTLSLISKSIGDDLNLETIWDNQQVSFELEEILRALVLDVNKVFLDSAGDRNPSEWAKKEDCWKAILEGVEIPSFTTAEEYQTAVDDDAPDTAEMPTQTIPKVRERIKGMSGIDLASIALWGRTGKLKRIEIDCLGTIANYADENWLKTPTEKQLRHIARALDIYDREAKTELAC